ncbi:MAG: hypothetical protein AB1631_07210 [Acidobacteriota bacterium]
MEDEGLNTVKQQDSKSLVWKRTFIAIILTCAFITAGATRIELAGKDRKQFAALSARLSEPGGYFDSDNLISNETSLQHVLGKVKEMNLSGGVYLGVGPDQGFLYISKIRPKLALMIDIRRDNLLQHLLYKALFERARNRVEYLCLLFGKPLPKTAGWEQKTVKELVDYIDNTASDAKLYERTAQEIRREVQKFGIPVTGSDLDTIAKIHEAFYEAGLDIRYSSHHRPPRNIYPTYRELILEHDLVGRQQHYFNSEDDFQFLKKMQEQDLIVPLVGDLSGPQAMKSVGKYVAEIKEKITAFYVSNVEFYLVRQGTYDKFIENVKSLPIDRNSLIIRSYFNYYAPPHPQAEGNHFSTQLIQRLEDLLKMCAAGECENYMDIVTRNSIPLR